jgi:DNA-directed RNA polymerase specialized sigma24 family protein
MTSAELPGNYNEAVSHFLKLYKQKLELQALKLTKCYRIDLHELLSRTTLTIWGKWPNEFRSLPEDERYKRALRILSNHARNLSKGARRNENRCDLLSNEELESLIQGITTFQDPVAVEAIFRDEQFAIYTAISQLDGRCRDVMTLIALGLESSDIRQELDLTVTNLTSIKLRARRLLREILDSGDKHEGGEPR